MKKLYADVIVDIAHEKLDRPFTYRVPESMRPEIEPGSAVRVPFGGGGRVIGGYVVACRDSCGLEDSRIRDIAEVTAGGETSEARMVALAAWMSRNYGSTMIQALKTVVPVRKRVSAVTTMTVSATPRSEEYLALCRKKQWKARQRALEALTSAGSLTADELKQEAGVTIAQIRELEKAGAAEISSASELRRLVKDAKVFPADVLTGEQSRAAGKIREEWRTSNRPVLLEGVTGSGKTLVYLELVADVLREGRQAIVLIPEIALTRQTVIRFVRRFGEKVSFLHSRLTGGERHDQMKAAKNGEISVMVGPRSALFTPFPELGLIIIDEEHEETYHSENVPRYHARETAVRRAEMEGAHVLLGSATPSLISAYRARTGEYFGVRLASRYGGAKLPSAEIVDMRQELQSGNRSVLSGRLRELIGETLEKGSQAMLFLNRRGYAGCVTCRACGHVIRCPHCDVSMTRHMNGRLICHYCGHESPDAAVCPSCGSPYIGGLTVGTEQVEEILNREFPGAKVVRMDADTTRGRGGHEAVLREFSDGGADILLGTQMIVKGHDFPDVTLVGILLADLSLSENDYRAGERTYSIIAQAVGRAGRGKAPGTAVIQTYQPDNYAVRAGARQDYETFYREETAFREMMSYPPAGSMAAILGSSRDEKLLSAGMGFIRRYIDRIDPRGKLRAIGPAPQTVGKVRDSYRQVIYIRNEDREALVLAKDRIEEYIAINSGFDGIRIQFDFNV